MKIQKFVFAVVMLASIAPQPLMTVSPATALSPSPGQSQNAVKYSEVVDHAFRFSEGIPAEFKGLEARIVIRDLPSSSQPESQIVILKQLDGTVRVILYNLKPGSLSLAEHYNQARKQDPSITPERLLKAVQIEKTEHSAKASIVRLVKRLFSISIPTNLSSDLCMDGTTYELWVQTPSNEIHASLSNCAYGKNNETSPIIRWIKAVESQERK